MIDQGFDDGLLSDRMREGSKRVGLAGLLLVVVLNNATGSPEWLTSGYQALLYVCFAGGVLILDFSRRDDWQVALLQILLTGVLLGFVVRQRGGGVPETFRGLRIAGLLGLILLVPFVRQDGHRRLTRAWPFVLGVAAVVGTHFYHAIGLPSGSGLASFPLVVGVILVLNLFLIPQHVSRRACFWAISRVTALVVGVGLVAYVVGPYEVFGFGVRFWPGSIPGTSIPVTRSILANPNTLGLLAFAGTVTALVETWEAFDATDPGVRWVVSAVVLAVDGLGLFLSYSRASWLATVLAVGVYGSFVIRNRRTVPRATVGLAGVTCAFLVVLATGLVPVSTGKRFGLWAGALRTYLANPTLFGAGIVVPGEVMAPYVGPAFAGDGPHNSYLTILLRAGLVGFVGYLILTAGSVLLGVVAHRSIDVAVLALAFGWVVHQLFEAYTLFQYSTGAVLASLAIGYLIVDRRIAPAADRQDEGRTLAKVFEYE